MLDNEWPYPRFFSGTVGVMLGIFLVALVSLGADPHAAEIAAPAPAMLAEPGVASHHRRVGRRGFMETPRDYPSSAPFDYRRYFNFPWYPLSRQEVSQFPAWRAWPHELPGDATSLSPDAAPQPHPAPPPAAPAEKSR